MADDPLNEIRECFLAILNIGTELGIAVHPALSDEMYRMAKLLGVDEELIPTERKLFLK